MDKNELLKMEKENRRKEINEEIEKKKLEVENLERKLQTWPWDVDVRDDLAPATDKFCLRCNGELRIVSSKDRTYVCLNEATDKLHKDSVCEWAGLVVAMWTTAPPEPKSQLTM